MSFLYQALIKEKQQAKSTQATSASSEPSSQSTGQTSPQQSAQFANVHNTPQPAFAMASQATSFAPEQGSKQHWFWLVIAALLMLVGLLGGYLFASKGQSDALVSAVQSQAELAQQKQAQLEQNLAAVEQTNQQLSQQLEQVKESQQQAEANSANTENTAKASPEVSNGKQVEIAVGQDGQIKTQVSQLNTASSSDYSESEILARSAANDVALDEIPEQLKSTFADAVKATENKPDPSLFSAQVNSGSSLPVLNDMDLSQVYWVPDMEYQMHIYASAPSERWIRINGKTLNQGDELIEGLTLLEIRQDQIIWQGKRRRFAHNALQDFVKRLK